MIKLTSSELTSRGQVRWVPPHSIKTVEENSDGSSLLWLGGSDYLYVRESPAEVLRSYRDMVFCIETAQSAVAKMNAIASRQKEVFEAIPVDQ
jgi:hypothetical protein